MKIVKTTKDLLPAEELDAFFAFSCLPIRTTQEIKAHQIKVCEEHRDGV